MSRSSQKRTILIGDVHGCIKELQLMIKQIRPQKTDRVIFLGDLINRGPDSVAVVDFVAQNDFECLMGNHEAEYLNEFKSNEKYYQLRQRLGSDLHTWISKRNKFIESNDFLAVHAGLEPGVHPSISEDNIIFNIRTWDPKTRAMKNLNNPPWYKGYTQTRPVFYGHWAKAGLTLRRYTMGLDSGCVYGKYLSAWVLEEYKLFQVKALKTWYVPPALRKKTLNTNSSDSKT